MSKEIQPLEELAKKRVLTNADFDVLSACLAKQDHDDVFTALIIIEKRQLSDAFKKTLFSMVLDKSRTKDVRECACRVLSTGKSNFGELREIISNKEGFLRVIGYAYVAHANHPFGERLELLIAGLDDENDEVQWAIIEQLGEMKAKAVKHLSTILDKESASTVVKLNCCIVLNSLGKNNKKINDIVASGLKQMKEYIRQKSLLALEQTDPVGAFERSAIPDDLVMVVGPMARDENLDIRKSAVICLGNAGIKAQKFALSISENLDVNDWPLQVFSIHALVRIKNYSEGVRKNVVPLLEKDDELVLSALKFLEGSSNLPIDLLKKVEPFATNADPEISSLAAKIIRKNRKATIKE